MAQYTVVTAIDTSIPILFLIIPKHLKVTAENNNFIIFVKREIVLRIVIA